MSSLPSSHLITIEVPEPISLQLLKKEIEMKMMFILGKSLIKSLRNCEFTTPSPKLIDILEEKDHNSAISTTASESQERESGAKKTQETSKRIKQFEIELEDKSYYERKRQEYFLDCFSKFEELLIQGNHIDKVALEKLRSFNLQFLKFLMNPDLKCQQADSICLSIFLLSSSKIGLSKKVFVKEAKKIFKKRAVKISRIKKSRCYASVKKLNLIVSEM